MAKILALVPDLMLASRVDGALGAAGHEVVVRSSAADAGPRPADEGHEAIVCDLEGADPDRIVGLGLPVLGFYSHVDHETRERATRAGVDVVVPRSRMARQLPELVERLLVDRDGPG